MPSAHKRPDASGGLMPSASLRHGGRADKPGSAKTWAGPYPADSGQPGVTLSPARVGVLGHWVDAAGSDNQPGYPAWHGQRQTLREQAGAAFPYAVGPVTYAMPTGTLHLGGTSLATPSPKPKPGMTSSHSSAASADEARSVSGACLHRSARL